MPNDNGLSWAESTRRDTPPEPIEPKLHCKRCSVPIYEGESVFTIAGEDLCKECVFDVYGRYA